MSVKISNSTSGNVSVTNVVENLREKLDSILTDTYSARELLDKQE